MTAKWREKVREETSRNNFTLTFKLLNGAEFNERLKKMSRWFYWWKSQFNLSKFLFSEGLLKATNLSFQLFRCCYCCFFIFQKYEFGTFTKRNKNVSQSKAGLICIRKSCISHAVLRENGNFIMAFYWKRASVKQKFWFTITLAKCQTYEIKARRMTSCKN